MRSVITNICLWIAVLTLAVSVGGNLFQATVVDPVWSASPPLSVKAFGESPYFARVATFHLNPIFFFGLFCLLATPFLAWNRPAMRLWLLVAVGCYVLIIVWTGLYFHPINDALFVRGGAGLDAATIAKMTRNWIAFDRIRYLLRITSFVCVVRAMVLSGRSG